MTEAKKLTQSQQLFVDSIIAGVADEAKKGLVVAASKPEMVDNLRKVWRKTAEHKAAQVKLFLSTLGGLLVLQVLSDATAGRTPFSSIHDLRDLWFYLAPVVLVAWRQYHPALTASQVDSAPGVTIVPDQVSDDPQPVDPPVDGDPGT